MSTPARDGVPEFCGPPEDDWFFWYFRLSANAVAMPYGLLPQRWDFRSPGDAPMN
jgi:hypothetical protein